MQIAAQAVDVQLIEDPGRRRSEHVRGVAGIVQIELHLRVAQVVGTQDVVAHGVFRETELVQDLATEWTSSASDMRLSWCW